MLVLFIHQHLLSAYQAGYMTQWLLNYKALRGCQYTGLTISGGFKWGDTAKICWDNIRIIGNIATC